VSGNGLVRVVTGTHAEIGPEAARALLRAMELAERVFRRNGSAPPAEWKAIAAELVKVAFADGMRPMPILASPPVESARSFDDPITPTQASYILRITARGVRDLCARGTLETAQRRPGGRWVIERAEVLRRAAVGRSTG
jgi:hypothetical protein